MRLYIGKLVTLAVLAVFAVSLLYSMLRMDGSVDPKQAEQMRDMMERAAIQCYALEGMYPPDIEYFKNYGIILNEDKFIYYYENNAIGNYMPDIEVFAK